MRIPPILFVLALIGCSGDAGDKNDDTAGGGDDTADTDVTYEPGCITVDGGGGYANLADAVTLAAEGSVIELCDGTWEEAVVVDKSVTIRGSAGTGSFLNGPGSDVPLTITGAGVTVENLTLESPRTAIVLDGATDANLVNITVASAGSWGVSATDATATIDGLVLVQPAAGGVQVAGGEIAIANGDFQYPASYGLDIADGAVVSLANTTITGTLMLSDDVSDGYAIQIDGGTLSMTDSAIAGADGIGIYGADADLSLTNTTISDIVYLGVFTFDSTYDFDGVAITGSYLQGAYMDGPEISLANTTVSTVTGTSCSLDYADWGVDGNPWCGGLNLVGDVVTLENLTVSGYENYGVIVQPNEEDLATLSWTGGSVDDVGRWGVYAAYVAGTLTDVAVTNTREPEIASPCDGYVDQSAALLAIYSELALDGVTLQGNAGWGYSALVGTTTIANSTFDGNACIGFVNYQNQATVTGTTFTNGSDRGGVYDSQGVLVLDGNTFLNNKSGAEYVYDDGSSVSRSVYSGGQGQDVFAYGSLSVSITNNTFTGGDTSLTIQVPSSAEVVGNSWSDYESYIAYFYQMPSSSPGIFADNVVDDVVGPVVQASYGPVEVSNVDVGTTRLSDTVTYEWYQDDVLQYSYSYQSSSSVLYASGYYYDDGAGSITDWPGSITVEDVSVVSAYDSFLYAYDAEVDIDGVELGDATYYGVYGYWSSYAPDVEINDMSVGSAGSTAFNFSNYFSEYGSVALSGVTVESASGGGISTSAVGELSLEDVSFGNIGGYGVYTSSRTYDYSYSYDPSTGSYTYTYTDLDSATEVTASNVTMASSGSYAFYLQGGSATLSEVTLSSAGYDGFVASGLTSVSISDSTISAPGAIGVDVVDSYSAYSYESSSYETIDADTVTTLTRVTVTDAGQSAFAVQGGSLVMQESSASASGANGLDLLSTSADVRGNTFSSNAAYGMTCSDATLSACSGNVFSDNGLGIHLNCSDACAE